MKARLVNGKLVKVANPIRLDNGDMIANPTEAILTDLGYLEVVDTPQPEAEEGYYASHYEERDGQIVRVWVKVAIEEAEL